MFQPTSQLEKGCMFHHIIRLYFISIIQQDAQHVMYSPNLQTNVHKIPMLPHGLQTFHPSAIDMDVRSHILPHGWCKPKRINSQGCEEFSWYRSFHDSNRPKLTGAFILLWHRLCCQNLLSHQDRNTLPSTVIHHKMKSDLISFTQIISSHGAKDDPSILWCKGPELTQLVNPIQVQEVISLQDQLSPTKGSVLGCDAVNMTNDLMHRPFHVLHFFHLQIKVLNSIDHFTCSLHQFRNFFNSDCAQHPMIDFISVICFHHIETQSYHAITHSERLAVLVHVQLYQRISMWQIREDLCTVWCRPQGKMSRPSLDDQHISHIHIHVIRRFNDNQHHQRAWSSYLTRLWVDIKQSDTTITQMIRP